MSKIFNKSILSAAILVSALALPQAAFAQWAVTVVGDVNTPSITATAESTATTAATISELNSYLQTGYNGNGLIPLLSSMNDKLGKVNATDAEFINNMDMAARKRMYDDHMLRMKAEAVPTQEEFMRACVAMSGRMTTSQGDGAGGGVADSFRRLRTYALVSEERFQTPATATTRIADLVRDRGANGFCSEQDVENGSPGCTQVGDMPSADIRSSSLTMGATAGPADPTNGSLNEAQQQAALAYINNSIPQPPSVPDDGRLETPEGKAYLAYLNKFQARYSAGRDAMMGLVSSHAEMPNPNQDSPAYQNWLHQKDAWGRIFGPKLAFPEAPSERDQMRFWVMKYAADPAYPGELAHMGTQSLLMEMVKIQALNAKINFDILQSLDNVNKQLFQINNNQLDPMTSAQLSATAAKISSTKKPGESD